MKKDLICVSCPLGCMLSVELSEKGEVISVTGNTCPRGKKYAEDECTNPVRMLTSTVKVNGGKLAVVPVKTSVPIPKGKMFDCMKVINNEVVDAPVRMGDVIICNICDTGADIVATNEA
ncbi:MAG: DUF1667 domain-containing protein [Oscillospiraceae bacterium]|nr:DUF1667 domain-containing protein [Oscillospiraceae bacterium]